MIALEPRNQLFLALPTMRSVIQNLDLIEFFELAWRTHLL